jgi:hypothetical protein
MGFTHYWSIKHLRGQTERNEQAYQRAISDIGKVARHYNKRCEETGDTESRLSGYTAHAKAGQYGGVKLNGKGDLAHEDFVLREHLTQEHGGFCKTARKPYDVVVVAALAILKHRLGDAISVSTDGDKSSWYAGVQLARRVTGLQIANPIADCYLNDRPVEIIKCYLKGVNSYIDKAIYLDTGDKLSDDELDVLADVAQDYIIQQNVEHFGYYQK